jgi:hypothetical protein
MKTLHARLAAVLCTAAVSLAAALPAQAALVDHGGGLVYDTEHDITWLVDPALLPGLTDWTSIVLFASALNYAGGSNWAAPGADFVDAGCPGAEGFGCIESQMGRLFYQQLGGQPGTSVFDSSGDSAQEIAAVALMPALTDGWFWSRQVADDGSNTAFAFNFGTGEQGIYETHLWGRALLVHAGQLGTPPIDEPSTLSMLLAGTALVEVLRRRRRRAAH